VLGKLDQSRDALRFEYTHAILSDGMCRRQNGGQRLSLMIRVSSSKINPAAVYSQCLGPVNMTSIFVKVFDFTYMSWVVI
jgi:hypothetical protein